MTARVVLCDLDDTLFDHLHATTFALTRLRETEAALAVWTLEVLVARHNEILEQLHRDVLAGTLTVDEARLARFTRLLEAAGQADAAARAVAAAAAYRVTYEQGWAAVPGAVALVEALGEAGVPVVIVTNNGVAEQRRKLEFVGLSTKIAALVTSEEVGTSKPEPGIFEEALARAGVTADRAVMLGDSWAADVVGARAAGIRPVWFNRRGLPAPDRALAAAVDQVTTLEPAAEVIERLMARGPLAPVEG
ncbi:MAG: HAD family hydrolase [Vicinamibacterales bacterium]